MNNQPELPTLEQWQNAKPYTQGFWSYWFSAWKGSTIPSERKCPYKKGTTEYDEFQTGVREAILEAQDSED